MKRNLPRHPESVSAAPDQSRRMIHWLENYDRETALPVSTEFTEVSFNVKITHLSVETAHGGSWLRA